MLSPRHCERSIQNLGLDCVGADAPRDDGCSCPLSFRGTRNVNPESRDSGIAAPHRPGMTSHLTPAYSSSLFFKHAADVVEQLHLHAIAAHDEALLEHGQQV